MMEFLSNWIEGIAIAVIIASIFEIILPNGIIHNVKSGIFNYECESITNLILSEILLFLVFSCLYLLFIFFIHYYLKKIYI